MTATRRLAQALLLRDALLAKAEVAAATRELGLAAAIDEVAAPALRHVDEVLGCRKASEGPVRAASRVLEEALRAAAPPEDPGAPLAVLAVPAAERHRLGAAAVGLALRADGWRCRGPLRLEPAEVAGAVQDARALWISATVPRALLQARDLLAAARAAGWSGLAAVGGPLLRRDPGLARVLGAASAPDARSAVNLARLAALQGGEVAR